MIPLHPMPAVDQWCPYCHVRLEVNGWYMPGMRSLADLACSRCARTFYGDLPSGHGLHYPMLLEKSTGTVHDRFGGSWFASWLQRSFATRSSIPIGFEAEETPPLRRAVLLNCLDRLYGHCVLKLLNAQYYLDHRPDVGLIVLVPRNLRCLVPDGVSAVWTADLPLERGIEWNDWLAQEIHRRICFLEECYLSVAFCHPHSADIDIERFSRVKPFPLAEWDRRLQQPTVTFIWRADRAWAGSSSMLRCDRQSRHVVALAMQLREKFPRLDFAVAGMGKAGGLPTWITDLRVTECDVSTERALCERYAKSHVVIGVHGSNMLLPSAHAGAVVELMPSDRWGNMIQDLLLQRDDQRETLFRYRIVPLTISVESLCDIVASVLSDRSPMLLHMQRARCTHAFFSETSEWSQARLALREHQAIAQ